MDVGDLGPPQDGAHTRIVFPREEARNRTGRRERRWKGTQGHIQSWEKKGGSSLPPGSFLKSRQG